MKTNDELAAQTARARLDIQDALRDAKEDFATRLGELSHTVSENDKAFEGKMLKLTGIVEANALKNLEGRQNLQAIMKANKEELKASVSDAVHKGEVRMQKAQDHLTKLNDETKAALNMKITTEIAALAKRANDQIEGLRLSSAEARKEMRKELLYAIRSMADQAKKNLDAATKEAQKKFLAVNAAEAAAAKKSAAGRAAIAADIKIQAANAKQELADGVATMQRSLLALKTQTQKKIKKTNKKVDAYGAALKKEAAEVNLLMKAQMTSLMGKIAAQKKAASADISAADAKSAAGFSSAMDEVNAALAAAAKDSEDKFGKTYEDMAKQRMELDNELAASVNGINDSIAKQAALADARFKKTVKDIKAARAEAAKQGKDARKDFATDLAAVTATIKKMETRLVGEVQVVA